MYLEPQLQVICACGKFFTQTALAQHLAISKICHYKRELRKQKENNNGLLRDALAQCACGFICSKSMMSCHQKGDAHARNVILRACAKICTICDLPYKQTEEVPFY
jgi:hypothetical protein